MRIASRTKTIAFFITLGACLIGVAIALNVVWLLKWREVTALVLGIILFGFIIAGVVLNTIVLVREIRRNEQQDSFLNAVTHELKTPIASIRLYLETLQRRQLEDAQRRKIYRIMLEDTDRLLGTVEQVLRAGEARHGGASRNGRQEIDFAAIARDALDLARIRHNLLPENLRFGDDPPSPVTVLGNPEELRTAVSNLLDNAVKYTGANKEIFVDLVTPDLDSVLLRVRDNGIGIPRRELKRIFKRFYRVLSRGPGQIKGTGLGLFIVRSIARRHGGEVFAESEGEGHGSTFTLRLPRVYRV